jgi:hypothetical protein
MGKHHITPALRAPIEAIARLAVLAATTLVFASCQAQKSSNPRVFVFTDINIDAGDPDDRQSLVHLLWYADEFEIEGIVPDRWDARGLEASLLAVEAYAADYETYDLTGRGYPHPSHVERRIARDLDGAIDLFARAAADDRSPLYVLLWGNMNNFGEAIRRHPELADNIRVISIGTGLMLERDLEYLPANWERSEPCVQLNWNGHGRNQVYNDPRFRDMWWLEINWTYNGMFTGDEPTEMFEKLSAYGALGQHMIDVTENEPWARYFRVGDTPSVLYVIDPRHDLDDPTQSSWAGRFSRPMPGERPNYFTDSSGPVEWDYADPCNSWHNHEAVFEHAKSTLEQERPGMYEALLGKLDQVYGERR